MLPGRWTNSHRCCWITVYVSCCNAQLNFIVDTMTCTCIVMLLSTCQLPSCNLFTQHVSYLSWRDTTSELWTPFHSFTPEYKSTAIITLCIFLTSNYHLPHYTVNPLFSSSRWDWQSHCYVGQSFLVLLCAGVVSSPTGSITLVSFWGKTCCYTHHTFLLGSPNGRVICTYQAYFLAPLPGIWGATWFSRFQVPSTAYFLAPLQPSSRRHIHQAAASGVSHFQPFTLFIVLLSLLLLCVVCFLYQKSKKISYLFLKLSFQVFYHV